MTNTLTLARLKAAAITLGFRVTYDRDANEYRVAHHRPSDPQWAEARAYYTHDRQDAYDTLQCMAMDLEAYFTRLALREGLASCEGLAS